MRRIIFTVLIFVVVLMSLCFFGVKWGNSNVLIDDFDELGIKITTGTNVRIEKQSPVDDFTLYRLTISGEAMTIYVGNHPQFPNDKIIESATVEEDLINGLHVKYYLQSSENNCTAEYLFDLSSDLYFPQFLHISFTNASTDALASFQGVISTIELRGDSGLNLNPD